MKKDVKKNKKTSTLEHIVNITSFTGLTGAFIYRAIEPLSVFSHPVMGTHAISENSYAHLSLFLASISAVYLIGSIREAYKDYKNK